MADKPADIHTLAPRLSYVEDLATWLKDNRGSGKGADPAKMYGAEIKRALRKLNAG